jgi:hypothetical protein
MFLDKKINEEKLNEFSFSDCVKWLQERSEHLIYSKGSDDTYWEAREIIRYLIKRYCNEYGFTSENYHDNEIGSLLYSTEKELDNYTKYAKTEKTKADVIAVFKSDMDDNSRRILHDINNK